MGYISRFPNAKKTNMKPKAVIKKRLWNNFKRKQNEKNIIRIVKSVVSKDVETKRTSVAQAVAPVCQISAVGTVNWYVLKDWHTNVWRILQGAGQTQRIGNQIKMKRWIIKGQIQPNFPGIAVPENLYLNRSHQGYLTLFFGRRKDVGAVDGNLFQLLDNGSSSIAPAGTSTEMMLPLNNEVYKVYWRKTFKMGASYGPNASQQQSPNNDFNLTRTFGFDVCKLIFKNRHLKFNDTDQSSSDRDIQRVALWAIWRPAIGSISNPNAGVSTTSSFYEINLTSYGEYEDA